MRSFLASGIRTDTTPTGSPMRSATVLGLRQSMTLLRPATPLCSPFPAMLPPNSPTPTAIAQRIATAAPQATVVKAFNTVGAE